MGEIPFSATQMVCHAMTILLLKFQSADILEFGENTKKVVAGSYVRNSHMGNLKQ